MGVLRSGTDKIWSPKTKDTLGLASFDDVQGAQTNMRFARIFEQKLDSGEEGVADGSLCWIRSHLAVD